MSKVNPYAVTAAEIEAEWNEALQQLQMFLVALGYDVHDCMDAGGRAMSGTIAEDTQVPRALGCAGAAE